MEAPITLEHHAGFAPAYGNRNNVQNVGDVEPMPCNRGLVELDVEERKARRLLYLDIGATLNGAQNSGDAIGRSRDLIEIVAIDLDGHIASHSGDELVEAHLNRLRIFIVVARQLADGSRDLLYDLVLCQPRIGPFLLRL